MTRVLIAVDETTMLSAIHQILLESGFLVNTASESERVLAMAREGACDLILLDAQLPDMDGLVACRLLRQESRIPILMLTAPAGYSARVEGLEAGADDCLTKPFNSRELVARMKALLRRSTLSRDPAPTLQASRLLIGDLEIDLIHRQAIRMGRYVRLRPKEFDLLVFLASHPGRTFTASKLLDDVWRFDNPSDARTVQVHIRWLRQKLEADPYHPSLIQTVRGKGYRLSAEEIRFC